MNDHSPNTLDAEHSAELEPTTLIESAYRRLRQDIIAGKHIPGEKLRVEHLKDDYEVGASTLREALARLVADTLVVSQGQRGFRVAPISLADFEDITNLRVMLETEAMRQAVTHGDEQWEGEVMVAFHRLSRVEEKLANKKTAPLGEWDERNRIFHQVLISACPSRWIRHFLAILNQQSERYRRIVLIKRPINRDVHAEHQAIFDATLARDSKRVSKLIETHIRLTLEAIKHLPPEFMANPGTSSRTAKPRKRLTVPNAG